MRCMWRIDRDSIAHQLSDIGSNLNLHFQKVLLNRGFEPPTLRTPIKFNLHKFPKRDWKITRECKKTETLLKIFWFKGSISLQFKEMLLFLLIKNKSYKNLYFKERFAIKLHVRKKMISHHRMTSVQILICTFKKFYQTEDSKLLTLAA